MILLWGLSADEPFDRVREELMNAGHRFAVLDQRVEPEQRIEFDPLCNAHLVVDGQRINFSDVSAVYTRVYDTRRLPQFRDADSPGLQQALANCDLLWSWVDQASACVLNRPSAMASNGSKPYQMALIQQHGFQVPETLVTTDSAALEAFWERHGQIIYKSVSGVRSVVSRLQPADRDRLSQLAWCPTQFQEWIPGCDYRVHIVGERVFAARIISDADDYRYARQQGHDVALQGTELPVEISDRAVRLATALRLPLSGLDLRRTPDGHWYCFEANPSPCFTYYESHTGQPIAAAVADLLARSYQ